jgi:hypothetical protein
MSKRARTATLIACSCVVVAIATVAGVSLASARPQSHHVTQASHKGKDATRRAIVRAKAGPAVVSNITYPAEGVDVSAGPPSSPGPLAADASSPSTVLASFVTQGVPKNVVGSLLSSQTPEIDLRTVTEEYPVSPGVTAGTPYTAWVVTYTNTSPIVLGPSSATSTSGCTFVGIMDGSTGDWTEFFQTCGS